MGLQLTAESLTNRDAWIHTTVRHKIKLELNSPVMDELSCFGFLVRCFSVYPSLCVSCDFSLPVFVSFPLFFLCTLCVICLLVCSPFPTSLPCFGPALFLCVSACVPSASLVHWYFCPSWIFSPLLYPLSFFSVFVLWIVLLPFCQCSCLHFSIPQIFVLLDDSWRTPFASHDTNLFNLRGNKWANKWLLLAYVRVQRSRLGFKVKERSADE